MVQETKTLGHILLIILTIYCQLNSEIKSKLVPKCYVNVLTTFKPGFTKW